MVKRDDRAELGCFGPDVLLVLFTLALVFFGPALAKWIAGN